MKTAKILLVFVALTLLVSIVLSVPTAVFNSVLNNEDSGTSQNAISNVVTLYQSSIIDSLQCGDTDSSNILDAGRVYSVRGTSTGQYAATDEEGSWEDYCRDDFELVEYFCGGGRSKVKFNKITCLSGCQDGACIAPPYCFDKDSGISEKVKGSIYIISSGINELLVSGLTPTQDSCVNSNTVREYYCDPLSASGFNHQDIPCEFGCSSGKCLRTAPAAVQAPQEESATPGSITLSPGQATTLNGIGVTLNPQLNSITLAETRTFYLGQNQLDGVSFNLVASGTPSSSSTSSTSGGGTLGVGGSGGSFF